MTLLDVKNVVIVGGGSSGWMAASSLTRAFPELKITVIEPKDIPIIGVGESTIGGIRVWTNFIGLEDDKFFKSTDASYKLSIKFTDFYQKNSGGFHYPFGDPLLQGSSFGLMDWHYKKYLYPETPPEDYVRCLLPASALFENNKMSSNEFGQFANFDPKKDTAYHFDAVKFGAFLRDEYCIPNGVKLINSVVKDAKLNENGIEYLILEDGQKIYADLFVDCTGFKSLLLGKYLEEPFDSYEDMLPNNRAWATRIKYKDRSKELEGFTNSTAIENGWCWNIPLWSRLGAGYVYSDKFVDPEEAKEQFKQYLMSEKMVVPRTKEEVEELEFKEVRMRVGRHKKMFVKNVVAIGLSAGFIEPLESNGLYTVHEFCFKLVDAISRNFKINQFDRDMYNQSAGILFDGFSQFVALHYALSHRNDTEYWRAVNQRNFDRLRDFPFTSKVNGFQSLAQQYMDNWEYPLNRAGIPYIGVGMHLNFINSHRWDNLNLLSGGVMFDSNTSISYDRIIHQSIETWEIRKNMWKEAAEKSLTLEEYLKKNFYSEEIDEV